MQSSRLGYIPQIDGLRAISVFFVLLTHANFQLGSYGIIGVDVFFAISGFLITTLLIEEFNQKSDISLKAFYWRRAIRLLPALLLLLSAVFIYTFLISDPEQIKETRFEIAASLFYFYNLAWLFESVNAPVLGHMWSLAVEEQFYLFWPIILILFLKSRWFNYLLTLILVFVAVSMVLKISGSSSDIWNSLFHESLFLGCAFAIWKKTNPDINVPAVAFWFSLGLLTLIGVFLHSSIIQFNPSLLHVSSGVAGLIIIGYILQNPQESLLSQPVLVYVGKLSYSLYLWHVPIFKWFKWYSPLEPWQSFILKFLVTFVLAALSYHYVESLMMKRFKKRENQQFSL